MTPTLDPDDRAALWQGIAVSLLLLLIGLAAEYYHWFPPNSCATPDL